MAINPVIEMNQNQIKKPIVILRPAEVAAKKGIPRTGQFELLRAGDFPKPIKLSGARSIGFIESEIDEWLEKRMAARDLEVPTAALDVAKDGAE
jgi:prophage regulatory protein